MFNEPLKKIVDNVEGGIAGLVMGLDGIPVETLHRATAADRHQHRRDGVLASS